MRNWGTLLNFSGFWIHFHKTQQLVLMGIHILSGSRKSIRKSADLQNCHKLYYLKHKLTVVKLLATLPYFSGLNSIHTFAFILLYNLPFLIYFPKLSNGYLKDWTSNLCVALWNEHVILIQLIFNGIVSWELIMYVSSAKWRLTKPCPL